MASHPNNLPNSVELSTVTSTPHEKMVFTWDIPNFKTLVEFTMAKDKSVLATLPFNLPETLFPMDVPEVTMTWKLEVVDGRSIRLFLCHDQPLLLPPLNLYARISVQRNCGWYDTDPPLKRITEGRMELKRICSSRITNDVLSGYGSLYLEMKADFFVDSEGIAEILPLTELNKFNNAAGEMKSFKLSKGIVLDQIASLYGDEATSDVIVSLVDKERKEEMGKFFCHSSILSGRSSVLGEMLHGSECLEKKDGKVILKIEEEEGVTLEVMDHFLTFLYSGKLKNGDETGPNGRPVWVGLLPQLVHMAHKFKVADLLEFCDVHLYRGVTRANVLEILSLANRHNLSRTLAKLQSKFSRNAELLMQSIVR